jgi:hypothetical protein
LRVHRIVLVATWILVSMLAVVGFANFSTSDEIPVAESSTTTYRPDLGSDAGAASAMAFAFMSDGAVLAQAQAVPVETTVPDAAITEGDDEGNSTATYERSSVLDEAAVREIVTSVFQPEDISRAIRSAWCASNFNPRYQNSETEAAGLFQITPDQWATYAASAGYGSGDIADPRANAAVAAWIVYQVGGSWSNLACSG